MAELSKQDYILRLSAQSHHTNHYVATLDELSYFESFGFVFPYKITMGVVFLCSDPLCPVRPIKQIGQNEGSADLVQVSNLINFNSAWAQFVQHCGGRPVVWPGLTPLFLQWSRAFPGARVIKIGEEPWITIQDYEPRGNSAKGVRAARNQALKAGCVVNEWTYSDILNHPEKREAIEQIHKAWQESTWVHVTGLFMSSRPLAEISGRRYFVCLSGQNVEAVLLATPIIPGETFYLEDIFLKPNAVNGVTEVLILEAIKALSASGIKDVSLGVVTFRKVSVFGNETHKGLKSRLNSAARSAIQIFYNSEGIDLSRKRFRPTYWESTYLAVFDNSNWRLLSYIRFCYFMIAFVFALSPRLQYNFFSNLRLAKLRKILVFFLVGLFAEIHSNNVQAQITPTSYHIVGLFNTFVPGGGQVLAGNYGLAITQATLEIGTFLVGYSVSSQHTLTLDGVPERIPRHHSRKNKSLKTDNALDIRNALWADWTQEFGIKYHFVNVFEAYRDAAKLENVQTEIDSTSISDLFLAPYDPKFILNGWVLAPLFLSAGMIYWDYKQTLSAGLPRTRHFNDASNDFYALTYVGMFPIGSAAPEEMFFRGYLQNELFYLVPSPFFSIPVSAAIFGLLHEADSRPIATVGGLIFGTLTYFDNNLLSRAIAFHFWVDVLSGIESYLLFMKAQSKLDSNQRGSNSPVRVAPVQIPLFDFQFNL